MMKPPLTLALLLVLVMPMMPMMATAQRGLTDPMRREHVSTGTTVEPEEPAPGGSVVLKLRVTPDRKMRIFAQGAKDFTPVVAVLSPAKGLNLRTPSFSAFKKQENPGNFKKVPLYPSSFDIEFSGTIDKSVKPGTTMRVTGSLTYQACDDRIVYPKRTMMVTWTIHVKDDRSTGVTAR